MGSIWRSRFKEWIVLLAIGTARGILIMWDVRRVNVKDSLLGEFSALILVDIEGGSSWWFSGVYGPSKACFRDRFWDELVGLSILCGDKWCIGGDFNVGSSLEDRRIWLADSSGIFSCKSAFAWLRRDNSIPINYQAKCIWKLSILVKVKVFTCLLVVGKLNVHSSLQRRRPYHSLSPW